MISSIFQHRFVGLPADTRWTNYLSERLFCTLYTRFVMWIGNCSRGNHHYSVMQKIVLRKFLDRLETLFYWLYAVWGDRLH